jgi:hypothetical protein
LNYDDSQLETIEQETVNTFLEHHKDEIIQAKIDLFAAFGTDLTSRECGTDFYYDWLNRKKEQAEIFDAPPIDEDTLKKKAKIYTLERDRIMGKRKIKPEAQGVIKNG